MSFLDNLLNTGADPALAAALAALEATHADDIAALQATHAADIATLQAAIDALGSGGGGGSNSSVGTWFNPPSMNDAAFSDEFDSGSPDLAVRGWTVRLFTGGGTCTRVGEVSNVIDPNSMAANTYRSTLCGAGLLLQCRDQILISKPVASSSMSCSVTGAVANNNNANAQVLAMIGNFGAATNAYSGRSGTGLFHAYHAGTFWSAVTTQPSHTHNVQLNSGTAATMNTFLPDGSLVKSTGGSTSVTADYAGAIVRSPSGLTGTYVLVRHIRKQGLPYVGPLIGSS